MFSEFFGNYLLNKGMINSTDLGRILQHQGEKRLHLGVLAINAGYMNAEQVEEVHRLQAQRDRRFGEIAVIEMYLTPNQLENLIKEQKSEHLILAQALIDNNLLTMEQFENELHLYKKTFELNDLQFDALLKGHTDQVISSFLKFDEDSPKYEYREYVTLFYKNIVRFIDRSVHIEHSKKAEKQKYPFMFSQVIFGADKFFTAICGDEKALLRIAEKNANETFETMDDYAMDSVGEFLNLHNGLFLVNMSDKQINLHMHVQKLEKDVEFTPIGDSYKIPIIIQNERFDLIIGEIQENQ